MEAGAGSRPRDDRSLSGSLFQEVYALRSDDSRHQWYGSSARSQQNRGSNISTRQSSRITGSHSVLMKSCGEPAG